MNQLLRELSRLGIPWMFGGDFNLFPPDGEAYQRFSESQKAYNSSRTDIMPLYDAYQAIPSLTEIIPPEYENGLCTSPTPLPQANWTRHLIISSSRLNSCRKALRPAERHTDPLRSLAVDR